MNAPVGGDCGGITDNTGNSLNETGSFSETNARATVIGATPESLGVTTTAGNGALAVQQFVRTDWLDLDGCEQQLCAALCVGCRQIPIGASIVPINTMATAARW
jgi:hypothetical protein